jgi:hypothetical protein
VRIIGDGRSPFHTRARIDEDGANRRCTEIEPERARRDGGYDRNSRG